MKHDFHSYTLTERTVCLLLCICLAAALGITPDTGAHAEETVLEETAPEETVLVETPAHVHTDSCYSIGNHLVCQLEEGPGHQHTDACWTKVRGELWCTNNTGAHVHDDSCYHWTNELTCGMEEGEGAHTHGEGCYEQEHVLICGFGDDSVIEEVAPLDTEEIIEDLNVAEEIIVEENESVAEPTPAPAATMNPGDGIVSLLQMERELSFAETSDPTADVEDEVDWWQMFADMPLTGVWADDLLRVAESQIGYTESERNYVEEVPGDPKGYTRYGAWYGIPYGDWCAMFISFCMYYANIPDSYVPYNCHCNEWIRELRDRGFYRSWDEGYVPKPGDFVFFDFDMDEKAEHMGIIRDVDLDKGWLTTIEGNRYNYVEEFVLTMDDYAIIGYCSLPENPAYDPLNVGTLRRNGEVEIPPETPAPTPPSWDSVSEAAAGIKTISITPTIESSWATY